MSKRSHTLSNFIFRREVDKVFPPRGPLCLHRLLKRANFTCSRWNLEETSKLVAYNNDQPDEPLCNDCYGKLLSDQKRQGEAIM